MRSGILCGGCVLVDVIKTIDRWPPEQEVALIAHETAECGGPGLNLALDLAKLGAEFPIAVVGAIGADRYGEQIATTCASLGVNGTGLRRHVGTPTSYTDVMVVKETGRRTFFHAQGANALLTEADFDLAGSNAAMLHLGSPGLHTRLDALDDVGETGFLRLLRTARGLGMKTNLELVSLPKPELALRAGPLLPHLSTIVINDHEAEALTGLTVTQGGVTTFAAAERAAADLLARGVAEAAFVHFPAGGVAATRDGGLYRCPSVVVPPEAIVSANGAGDAFAAGAMFGTLSGWPIAECLRLANAAAATALRSASTFAGVLPFSECLALAERWGWRHVVE
jgi:sugar/nucleoside kinase (ribokinase family)